MRKALLLVALALLCLTGCKPLRSTDYHPLDQAGMWYGQIQELRKLDTTDAEVAELVKLKEAGIPDEACVELVSIAHAQKHPFVSADAVLSLARAGFSESNVLEIARTDQLDAMSGEVVTLRLTGFSPEVALDVARRRAKGLTTLSTLEIAQLKNTGLTEKQILDRIDRGMADAEADAEITARRRAANKTGFVRNRGRRRR
jgi:hypothetical protein